MATEMNQDVYEVTTTDIKAMNETATDVEVPELQFLRDGEVKIFVQEAGESTVDDDFGPFQSASQSPQEKAFNNPGFNNLMHKGVEVVNDTLKTSGHMTKAGALLEKIGKTVRGAAGTVKDGIVACYKIAKDNVAKIPSKFMKFCKSVAKAVDNVVKKMHSMGNKIRGRTGSYDVAKNNMTSAMVEAEQERRAKEQLQSTINALPSDKKGPVIETQGVLHESVIKDQQSKQKNLTKKIIRGAQGTPQEGVDRISEENEIKSGDVLTPLPGDKKANKPKKKSLKETLKDLVKGGKKKPGERKCTDKNTAKVV